MENSKNICECCGNKKVEWLKDLTITNIHQQLCQLCYKEIDDTLLHKYQSIVDEIRGFVEGHLWYIPAGKPSSPRVKTTDKTILALESILNRSGGN